jgi:hypothetical protein
MYDDSSALMMIEDLRIEADRINGEGLDYVGEFLLNGQCIGTNINMKKSYLNGSNELVYAGTIDNHQTIIGSWSS